MIFGRAAEEIDACRRAGVPVEVVPGITAVLGAAAELALPLTDRQHCRRLQFVAGHAKDADVPNHDWGSLADPGATTVFYMGARTFSAKVQRLLAAGLDPETPALVVSSATTPRSRHVFCRARELPRAIAGFDRAEPCLILISQTMRAPNDDGSEAPRAGRSVEAVEFDGAGEQDHPFATEDLAASHFVV